MPRHVVNFTHKSYNHILVIDSVGLDLKTKGLVLFSQILPQWSFYAFKAQIYNFLRFY